SYEYMDCKRLHGDAWLRRLFDLYSYKFKEQSFALVLAVDNVAFDFLRLYRDQLFPETPVVFCGVNNFRDEMLQGLHLFTGVVEDLALRETLDVALRLHPKTKEIVVYGDLSPTYLANRTLLEQALSAFSSPPAVIYFERNQLRFDELHAHLQNLAADSLILLLTTIRDRQGVLLSFEKSIAMLAAVSRVPIYGCWDFFLGHGLVGGKLVSGFSQGQTAAKMGLKGLREKNFSSLAVLRNSPNLFMFDYRQLRRFGLDPAQLPADSTVINRPVSFCEKYASWVWKFGILLVGLSVVVILLVISNLRRRRVEMALRESEERLQTIFAAARNVSLILTDLDGCQARILEFSSGAEVIFGYSRTEVIGKPVAMLHRPEEVARFPQMIASMRQKRAGFNGETILLKKDGTAFPALFTTYPIFDEKEQLKTILGVTVEITALCKARKALEQSELHFREQFDSISDLVYTHDLEGRLQTVNLAVAKTLGFERAEFIGRKISDFMKPELRPLFITEYLEPIRTRGRAAGITSYFSKSGDKVYIEHQCTLVQPESGAAYVSGIGRNVTERILAERQVSKLRQQMLQAEKMEAIGVLVGGLTHDFNNLLMGIQGNVSLLLTARPPQDQDYKKLKNIEQYVQSGTALTRQLLGFARGGKYEVKLTDLNQLIINHNRMFGSTRKEVTIHEQLALQLPAVAIDRGQIEQCLLNLYINSWQAMPKGGDLYVQTETVVLDQDYVAAFSRRPGEYVKILVRDTGVGMDEATRKRIFEPFFSTREKDRGTGLGLASVYGIIQNHDGIISVGSEPGQGTTVTLYLPAAQGEVAASESAKADDDELLYGTEGILLVDDESMILEVNSQMLEMMGYRVLTADTGVTALEIYQANRDRIDLVIFDMIMPKMGGGEFYERLQALDPEVKTLLSSGYSLDGQAQKIIDQGCLGFIQKPFKISQLSHKIREIMDGER
ncbi:MAG: PAS domain S-box protein, partial [Deltaproteobacteria bacterium]|nr:PAS domain S-box protein [Deltaproteobacteria bacterium]